MEGHQFGVGRLCLSLGVKVAETQVGHRSPTDDQKLDILEICFIRVELLFAITIIRLKLSVSI